MGKLIQFDDYRVAAVAQLVEHLVVVQAVAGSNPVGRPISLREMVF